MAYDSQPETRAHIEQVRTYIREIMDELHHRALVHDSSKLEEPELPYFNEYTPKLRSCEYGSEEYLQHLDAIRPALDHHYSVNQHHPEYWPNGIADMSLIDIIEMLADWKAATLRQRNGNLEKSISDNANRFGYGEEMERLLRTTARRMGWI